MKKSKSDAIEVTGYDSPSHLIHARIAELGDWRGEVLARVRKLIKEADPGVVEDVKWRKPSNPGGVPVWSHDGIICTGETYKNCVKLTFAKGALLEDPSGLFNASLEGNTRRAIDIHEGDKINEKALKALILAAVALNTSLRAEARPARPEETEERLKGQRKTGRKILSDSCAGRPAKEQSQHPSGRRNAWEILPVVDNESSPKTPARWVGAFLKQVH
ncbi:MAG: DUF1801 domain-containing protein, partial [Candidatus Hydrogenedentes bacterium]|nr:DUF1801 domain-containing protein [Candidatus Hydrogenedentota bacterium]